MVSGTYYKTENPWFLQYLVTTLTFTLVSRNVTLAARSIPVSVTITSYWIFVMTRGNIDNNIDYRLYLGYRWQYCTEKNSRYCQVALVTSGNSWLFQKVWASRFVILYMSRFPYCKSLIVITTGGVRGDIFRLASLAPS